MNYIYRYFFNLPYKPEPQKFQRNDTLLEDHCHQFILEIILGLSNDKHPKFVDNNYLKKQPHPRYQ